MAAATLQIKAMVKRCQNYFKKNLYPNSLYIKLSPPPFLLESKLSKDLLHLLIMTIRAQTNSRTKTEIKQKIGKVTESLSYLLQSCQYTNTLLVRWETTFSLAVIVQQFSKLQCSSDLRGCTPSENLQSQTIFIIIPKYYLPFGLSFSHGCTVGFSRGYIICDI